MPSQTANLATLAADGNWMACYMSVVKGNLVLTGAVSATPAADGVVNLAYTVSSGSASNVKPGMRVDVYRSNGTDLKGRTRVRYAGTISTTNLPIRENAKGNIYIVSGDILKVYDDVRLSDKLVQASSTFAPDQLTYSDQGSNPPPLACSGGAWAGWDTMLPIAMTGSNSIWVDPDSNGPLTHLWTYPSGLTGSSTSAADPNITAATAGEYEVAHSVTDDDNTKSVIQYVPIVVHTTASPPYDILLETPDGDEQNGWSARVQVFDNAALSDIPDGARVILWKEEYLAGVRQSFGADSSGRSHIILDGYIRREEGEFDAEDGVETLTFEVISPMARLEELVGYSKVMDRQASPDAWSEITTLKTKRAIIQIWCWYTNACEAGFDLVFTSSYRDKNYPLLFLNESTPLAQMRELADGTAARLTCLMGGRFLVHTKGERKAIADRAAVTRTLTITSGMYLRRRYTREHWSTLKYFELRGFIAATTVAGALPVFSRWYGQSPGEGNQTVIEERRIVDSQTDANNEAGMGGAAAAGEYTIANGTKQRAVDLEYDFPSSYASIFDFYDEFVDVDDTTALRELDFDANSATFVFVGGSFGYDNDTGTGIFTARFRQATAGLEGQTHVPLQENDNGLPPYTGPGTTFPLPGSLLPPPALFLTPRGTQNLGMVLNDGYVYLTGPQLTGAGFDVPAASGGPIWVRYALGTPDYLKMFIVDGSSPRYQNGATTASAVHGWLMSGSKMQRITDIAGVTGSPRVLTDQLAYRATLAASVYSRSTEFSFNGQYGVTVGIYRDGANAGVYAAYTKNGGATWSSETRLTAFIGADADANIFPGAWVSPFASGKAYVTVFTSTTYQATSAGYVIDLSVGSPSWAAISAGSNGPLLTGVNLAQCIRVAIDNEMRAYFGALDYPGDGTSVTTSHLYRTNTAGTAKTDIRPTGSDGKLYGARFARSIALAHDDSRKVLLIGTYDYPGLTTDYTAIFYSNDRGDTWTEILPPAAGYTYWGGHAVGGGRNDFYAWGLDGRIAYYDGLTVDDRRGNIPTDFPTAGHVLNIFGF